MGVLGSTSNSENRLKVVVVGAARVGKTAIVDHWLGLLPSDHYHPTEGVEEREVRRDFMKEHNACLVVHDVGSHVVHEKDRAAAVLRDADAVVLVYSCQQLQETIAKLMETWVRLLIYKMPETASILLSVGNRQEITDNFTRVLAQEEEELYDALPGPTKDAVHCFQGDKPASDEAALEAVFRLAFSTPV